MSDKKYTFFWSGPFSQWYPSTFVINGIEFNCAEQWMMFCKATLFNDMETRHKIMATSNPKNQKAFGRQVANFQPDIWNNIARFLVYQGSLAKYSQNNELFVELAKTRGTTLVEASPYDTVWGIGLNAEDAANTPESEWRGYNWLGQVLTQLREDLLEDIAAQVLGSRSMAPLLQF